MNRRFIGMILGVLSIVGGLASIGSVVGRSEIDSTKYYDMKCWYQIVPTEVVEACKDGKVTLFEYYHVSSAMKKEMDSKEKRELMGMTLYSAKEVTAGQEGPGLTE
jgi:hypothetical protein